MSLLFTPVCAHQVSNTLVCANIKQYLNDYNNLIKHEYEELDVPSKEMIIKFSNSKLNLFDDNIKYSDIGQTLLFYLAI